MSINSHKPIIIFAELSEYILNAFKRIFSDLSLNTNTSHNIDWFSRNYIEILNTLECTQIQPTFIRQNFVLLVDLLICCKSAKTWMLRSVKLIVWEFEIRSLTTQFSSVGSSYIGISKKNIFKKRKKISISIFNQHNMTQS